ncbi:MAG: hypothetical protein ACRENZ_11915, partial [Thermodesulfobacteriota bacterium]
TSVIRASLALSIKDGTTLKTPLATYYSLRSIIFFAFGPGISVFRFCVCLPIPSSPRENLIHAIS